MRTLRPVPKRVLGLLGGAGLVLGVVAVVPDSAGAAPARHDTMGTYIVQMADLPVAGYTGKVPGYRATKPAKGGKLNARSADATRYRGYLTAKHNALINAAGNVGKVYDYTTGFNGFAAQMSSTTAAKLAHTAGVLSVSKNSTRYADTVSTPHFLGLDAAKGLWAKLGGPAKAGGGQSLVIGDIDSGIWPENPAFAPLTNATRLDGWHGTCVTGEQWTTANCNNKLVGARFYNAGQGGDAAIHQAPFVNEVASPRDINGHGSHTASTAAGNFGTDVIVNGNNLGKASGMAPAARIAVYKALWHTGASASGSTADLTQAIEDAVSDGVDVINYSISGATDTDVDPIAIEFLFAADAGVFVSSSAGNNGPDSETVEKNYPWVTTVAAGTHDRTFQATVTLGNGASFSGPGLGAAVPSSPLVLSSTVGLAGANATSARLCFSRTWDPAHPEGFLDPAKVTGKIVVCDRGTNDRIDKSKAVKEAGGVGMVLTNVTPNTLNADFHAVPTVHVSDTDGAAIKAYVSGTANATASLGASQKLTVEAPMVAGFSSRGPALSANGDVLKPDIMAPGVDVIAAVSPASGGLNFNFLSGTSMATPHIAGIAALYKQLHPKWTPMMIKSAMQTSASRTDNAGNPITGDDGSPAGAFDYGSGQVNPNAGMEPGFVYDSDFTDWIQFLCGTGELAATSTSCQQFGSIDPSDINAANIAVGDLAGKQTVTRWVTSTDKVDRRYTPQVTAPPGFTATVSPSRLDLPAGWTRSYTVTFTRTTAPFGEFSMGGLDWVGGGHVVHSQLAVRAVAMKAPGQVSGTGTSGTVSLPFTAGYTGTLATSVSGLIAGTAHPATLTQPSATSFPTTAPTAGPHTAKFTVTAPAGSTFARLATFDADVPAGTDVDIFVFRAGTANLVGVSAGGSAQEQVDLVNPTGSYDVYVDLFALAPGVTSQAVSPFDWIVGPSAGNMTVSPATTAVTLARNGSLSVSWTGLTAGQRYVGRVNFSDGTNPTGGTTVAVAA
jgi:subtilisin family serine protease